LLVQGYDMEDAMIINKASYERGFAHASVFYSLPVDLRIEQVRLFAVLKSVLLLIVLISSRVLPQPICTLLLIRPVCAHRTSTRMDCRCKVEHEHDNTTRCVALR
jgi:hypothetical protein